MDRERWRQIDSIFKSALELSSDERADFIKRACAGDEELCAEVESLIAHDREGDELEEPAFEEATRLFAAEAQKEQALAGKIVGPYRIVSRIGVGGMGEVYLAVHERTGRKVALKLLPAHHTRDEQRVRRFQQEARAVLALNHPNIVTVYDIEQADGASVIASEFIEGETLRARLSRGTLAAADALDVAAQVAAALSAAHAAGIVHRDIKPENVMLRPDGFVKVLDFGLAKLTEQTDGAKSEAATRAIVNTDPGIVLGTVNYMSPEQARGRETDARTDIWSLGVVLYEMLTGRAPFAGESQADVLAAIIGREPPPVARNLPGAPEALEWITTKALTKDREGRYQTAKELLTDLKRLKQQLEFDVAAERGRGVVTAPVSGAQPSAGVVRTTGAGTSPTKDDAARQTSSAEVIFGELKRHKRGAILVAAIASLALMAGALGLYKLLRTTGAPPLAFQKISVRQLADTGEAVDAIVSSNGEFVVYIKEEAGRQSLWLRQTSAASSVQIVPATEGQRIGAPLFSPDGAFIYYLKAPQRSLRATLYRTPKLGGGGETKLVEDISFQDTRNNFTLSPDGNRLAFIRLDAGLNRSLVITDQDGGGERVLYERKLPEFISGAAWSPDGRTIACVRGTFIGAKVLLGVSVADGSVREVTGRKWNHIAGFAWLRDSGGLVAAAAEHGELYQLWRLPFAEGDAERITNDVSTYTSASLTSDSSVLAAVQVNVVQNIWTAAPVARGTTSTVETEAAQLTFGGGRYDGHRGLVWTTDGRIVYHSLAGGSDDIWIVNADGSGQRQLTDGKGTNVYPVISPDGRYIVYDSDHGGSFDLWRMGLDGADARQIMRDCGIASVSPDSRWVLCYKGGRGIVWRVPLEGGEPVRVPLNENELAASPVISPDGRLVAYNYTTTEPGAQWRIAIFPFEGGASPLKVFDVIGSPIRTLHWTADGRAICNIDTQQGVSNIVCRPLDGGEPFAVTNFKSGLIDNFDWSADGRRLALSRFSATSGVVLITDTK
ncbi:MAG: eukaryotic-like serine/threonine-protein kinase [Acidobacteriota bacterium]|jgi:serine/threonine protein kinase/Tol biopolymer transport system component|nr:eukaryotic-like serine/threonine-protein kinase [Acidobacteriota bacterium]